MGSACLCSFAPQYPEGIREYGYNPSFAIRGLHYDIQKVSGWMPPSCSLPSRCALSCFLSPALRGASPYLSTRLTSKLQLPFGIVPDPLVPSN